MAVRGREWVVLPGSTDDFLKVRPLGGGADDVAGILVDVEAPRPASFPPPSEHDLGDQVGAGLLRSALRVGFRSSAGPFRSLASLAVEPRPYQLVPLLLALRQDVVRLLIADDVGIGKTIEAGLVAAELLASGDARGLTVLCSPALAEQWQDELRMKLGIDPELVLPSTVMGWSAPESAPSRCSSAIPHRRLDRLHQVAAPPLRVPAVLPRPGDRRRSPHLRYR